MDNVQMATLGQCFAHCAHTFSYWAWIIAPLLLGGAGVYVIHKEGVKTNKDVDNIIKWVCIAVAFFVVCGIFMRPCDLHQNTTAANAAANQWIGY